MVLNKLLQRETPSAAVFTKSPASAHLRRANPGNVEVLYLFPQGIAIEPQKAGCAQLIPACRPQGKREQGPFDLGNHPFMHAVGRQTIAVGGKQRLQVMVYSIGQGDLAACRAGSA